MADDLEIILQDDVRRIFETFSNLLNVRIAFFSRTGKGLTAAKGIGLSPLCSFIRNEMGLVEECRRCDDEKRALCAKMGRMLTYRCHAGLTESIAPVFALDAIIGFMMIGQIRHSPAIHPALVRRCGSARQRARLERIFAGQPYIPSRRLKDIVHLFSALVGYIVGKNLISIKRNLVLSMAVAYIDANLDKNISLDAVAFHCGRSRSTITHLFSRELKKSFKRFVIEKKMNRAEVLLKEDRDLRIGEVADSLSFCDPFYFSKLYKKVKGYSPSVIRRAMIKSNRRERIPTRFGRGLG